MNKKLLVKMFKDYLKGNNAGEAEGICYMDDNTDVYFHQDYKEFTVSLYDPRELPDSKPKTTKEDVECAREIGEAIRKGDRKVFE